MADVELPEFLGLGTMLGSVAFALCIGKLMTSVVVLTAVGVVIGACLFYAGFRNGRGRLYLLDEVVRFVSPRSNWECRYDRITRVRSESSGAGAVVFIDTADGETLSTISLRHPSRVVDRILIGMSAERNIARSSSPDAVPATTDRLRSNSARAEESFGPTINRPAEMRVAVQDENNPQTFYKSVRAAAVIGCIILAAGLCAAYFLNDRTVALLVGGWVVFIGLAFLCAAFYFRGERCELFESCIRLCRREKVLWSIPYSDLKQIYLKSSNKSPDVIVLVLRDGSMRKFMSGDNAKTIGSIVTARIATP